MKVEGNQRFCMKANADKWRSEGEPGDDRYRGEKGHGPCGNSSSGFPQVGVASADPRLVGSSRATGAFRMWDVFISHASEDKETVAGPLAEALRRRGLAVWFDETNIQLGDGLRRTIDRGLAESSHGVVILSPAFFRREWTAAGIGRPGGARPPVPGNAAAGLA